MLELDDPRWNTLPAAGAGARVPQLLRALAEGDAQAWGPLYNQICHQGTVHGSAYAAAPHLVRLARDGILDITTLALLIGDMVAGTRDEASIPAELRADWGPSRDTARLLIEQGFRECRVEEDAIYQLRAIAQFDAELALAHALFELTESCLYPCCACGETGEIDVAELEEAGGTVDHPLIRFAREAGHARLADQVRGILELRCTGCGERLYPSPRAEWR